jgi:hypothetical protein
VRTLSYRWNSDTSQVQEQGHSRQFGCVIDDQGSRDPFPAVTGLFPPLCRGRLWNPLDSFFSGQLELLSLLNVGA